jgi:hypothetical protein
MIDLVLAGENAGVNDLASGLPTDQRRQAILVGILRLHFDLLDCESRIETAPLRDRSIARFPMIARTTTALVQPRAREGNTRLRVNLAGKIQPCWQSERPSSFFLIILELKARSDISASQEMMPWKQRNRLMSEILSRADVLGLAAGRRFGSKNCRCEPNFIPAGGPSLSSRRNLQDV